METEPFKINIFVGVEFHENLVGLQMSGIFTDKETSATHVFYLVCQNFLHWTCWYNQPYISIRLDFNCCLRKAIHYGDVCFSGYMTVEGHDGYSGHRLIQGPARPTSPFDWWNAPFGQPKYECIMSRNNLGLLTWKTLQIWFLVVISVHVI